MRWPASHSEVQALRDQVQALTSALETANAVAAEERRAARRSEARLRRTLESLANIGVTQAFGRPLFDEGLAPAAPIRIQSRSLATDAPTIAQRMAAEKERAKADLIAFFTGEEKAS